MMLIMAVSSTGTNPSDSVLEKSIYQFCGLFLELN
jgi:hypothetical protein